MFYQVGGRVLANIAGALPQQCAGRGCRAVVIGPMTCGSAANVTES